MRFEMHWLGGRRKPEYSITLIKQFRIVFLCNDDHPGAFLFCRSIYILKAIDSLTWDL